MRCPFCGSSATAEDFCDDCGAALRSSRLPVKRAPALPPALWRQAAPALVRGAALIVAGLAAEWLMRSLTERALRHPFAGKKSSRKSKALAIREAGKPHEGIIDISETVVMRRVILRR